MTGRSIAVDGTVLLTDHPWPGVEIERDILARAGIVSYDRDVRAGNWSPGRFPLRRVSDLVVGVVGLGRVGQRTAAKFVLLGCRVLGSATSPARVPDGVELVSEQQLLDEADVVTIHVPLRPSTRHLVDGAFLARMRPRSLLVNASRGPVVDTAALLHALRSGSLAAAALDVVDGEPDVPGELRELDNVILTPHVAFSSDLSVIELRTRATEEVVAVLTGAQPRDPVVLPAPAP